MLVNRTSFAITFLESKTYLNTIKLGGGVKTLYGNIVTNIVVSLLGER